MITKLLFCHLLLLFTFSYSYAQNRDITGDWFVLYNEGNRQFRGTEYVVKIEQKGQLFVVTHVKEQYPGVLPAEGNYTMDGSGNLIKGGFKIAFIKNDLVYENGGSIELQSMKEFGRLDKYMYRSAQLMVKADSAKDNKEKQEYLKESIACVDTVISKSDKCIECYYNRSLAWYKADDIDSAISDLKKVSLLDADYSMIPEMHKAFIQYYVHNAEINYKKDGDLTEVIAAYKKALTIDSLDADVWYNMGGAYYTNKEYAKAVDAFSKCLQTDPNNENALQGLQAAREMVNNK